MLNMYKDNFSNSKKDQNIRRERPNFSARGNKVHFISLGCPRNRVDTEVMLGLLLKSGYEATAELQSADYIVVNTCGFLQAAREESVSTIGEAVKERKNGAKVIATGCMVQTHSDEIKNAHPSVDYFLGSGDVEAILKAVEAEERGEQISSARSYLEVGEVPRKLSENGSFAYLKIAEGCRKRCAYCIIPDIKGPLKSKSVERVIKEFKALLDQGVKEVILIAQDLGDWGKDLGFKKNSGLIHLLKEILKEERPYWLRLLYLYPDEITSELIDLMKSDSRICPYLDMPIQHVNNEILKSMRRATTKEAIIKTILELRAKIPEISIRTSLIAGFPGETESQVDELAEFLTEYPLDNVGIFEYSQEPGSHAATLDGQISEEVKKSRQERLARIQQGLVLDQSEKLLGKKVKVLIESFHSESNLLMVGRHQGQCPDIDGQVIVNDHQVVDEFGKWYEVEITGLAGYDLIGRACAKHVS